ncbi:hypothetical protein Deba_0113 [Desulfarculus baarsii DSM 2075]|uniref:Uncharacterized protein n=1 Tax=Desulfarculus baarsii (strain ATCC 33931 / DSM 2075 / LMG 7858 / VKM B-1802 / 2st14) TaxID=644282 RepID=E1QDH3_DESB2|nr:hypothetical protein [Desulfarculus baarsii]ADK83492.1 hypothetical protein Deba_0113 [Desulfarculus baarsii DSM 2075]
MGVESIRRRLARLEAGQPEKNICAHDWGVPRFATEDAWFRAAKAQQAELLAVERDRRTPHAQ